MTKNILGLSSGVGAQLEKTGPDAVINHLRRKKYIEPTELSSLTEALLSPEFVNKVVGLFVKDYQAGVRLVLDNFVWLVPRGLGEQYPQAFAALKTAFRQKFTACLQKNLGTKKFASVQIVPTQRSVFDDENPELNENESYLRRLFSQDLTTEKNIWGKTEKFVAVQTLGSRTDILAYYESLSNEKNISFAAKIVPNFKFQYNFETGQSELMDGTSFVDLLQHLQTEFGNIPFGLNCFSPSHYPLLLGELELHPETKKWFIANQISVMPNLYDPDADEAKVTKITPSGNPLWQSPETYNEVMRKYILPTLALNNHEKYACGCCGSDHGTCLQDQKNIHAFATNSV